MPSLQVCAKHSKPSQQTEVVICHPLAKDDVASLNDPQLYVDTLPSAEQVKQEFVTARSLSRKPHFPAAAASIRFDCGPSGAVYRG